MCGRFVSATPLADVATYFAAEPQIAELDPDYNVTPRRTIYVVRELEDGSVPQRVLSGLRWGLIPSWSKDPAIGDRLINARGESVREKPSFRSAFSKRRCVIPADGFYEWQTGPGGKRPMYIHRRDGLPLAFAGLWETWRDPTTHHGIETCTIITTEANTTLAEVHQRMPVILERDACDVWIDGLHRGEPDLLEALLVPAADDALVMHEVGRAVNSPKNNDPSLIAPAVPDSLF